MNHFVPIPFFIAAIIIYIVCDKYKLKSFRFIAKLIIALSVIVFVFEYAKYLGYDILEIVTAKLF